jgi:hypothetical protein
VDKHKCYTLPYFGQTSQFSHVSLLYIVVFSYAMSTKSIAVVVTLVLIASAAGTMALPQMIGSANAAACPNGQPPQQGKCVTPTGHQPECPTGTTPSDGTCQETFTSSGTAARQECKRLGGTDFDPSTKTCTGIPKQCPSGETNLNGQCVIFTKPGSG